MIATSLASVTRPLWRLLEHYHIDPEFVFREAGLDPALMDQPRGRYKLKSVLRAWTKADALIDDPCLGLKVADFWRPTDFHALGYAFLASSTLRTALGRIVRYVAVVNDRAGYTIDQTGETVIFTYRSAASDLTIPPLFEDGRWALITDMCRTSYGEQLDPLEVRFQRPEPSCKGDFYGFFRCPLIFGTEASALVLSSAVVDRPLPAANRELARANDQILTGFLSKLTDDDLITRVKTAIVQELPSGSPNDEIIAKSVYMTSRTLQRRLAALGTTYSKLLDAVRRELAEQYVTDPSRSLSEISYLLGFSELSAFSRAFKRWMGQTPSEIREIVTA